MRYSRLAIFGCVLATVILTGGARATEVPKLIGRVNDYANVLSADQRSTLEAQLKVIEDKTPTHDQVAVLAPSSLQGESIEQYSIDVARAWQLGQKGVDNGILIIVAPHERQMRIEVGRRLEPALTDAQAELILHDQVRPYLAKGTEDYFDAFQAAIASIQDVLMSPDGAPVAPVAEQKTDASSVDIFVAAVFILLVVVGGAIFLWLVSRSHKQTELEDELPDESHREEEPEGAGESDVPSALLSGAILGAAASHHREPAQRLQEEERSLDEDDESSSLNSSSSSSSDESFGGGFSGGGGGFGGGGASGSF